MAKRGRPAKPVEDHLRSGHYRPSKHGPRPTVPDPVEGPPDKPGGLTPEQAAKWDATVPHLSHLLRPYHAALLVELCRWQVIADQCAASLTADLDAGEYAKGLNALATATGMLLALSQRFGLTPADRAKMKLMPTTAPAQSRPKVATRPRTALDGQAPPQNGA